MCSDGLLIFVIRVIIAELVVVVDSDRVHVVDVCVWQRAATL